MAQHRVFCFAERIKGSYLVQHERIHLIARQVQIASAETLQVGIPRMRAYGNARFFGTAHRFAHDARVASVHATRNVYAAHKGDNLLVKPQRVAPKTLCDVAV